MRFIVCVLRCAFFALAYFSTTVVPGAAESSDPIRGVALVIGQSEYDALAPLPNATRDADEVAALLDDLGFDVSRKTDLNAADLRLHLGRFAQDAAGAEAAVLYYSGHGIEAGGENWLVATDADAASLGSGQGLVALAPVLAEVAAKAPLTMFFLDACRTSPFAPGAELVADGKALPVSPAGLGLPRGAVALDEPADAPKGGKVVGTVIGYAAEPGAVAYDGPPGGTSFYAAALTRHLGASADHEFGAVMRMVAEEVYLKTGGRQRPWVNESLMRSLYFGGTPPALSPEDEMILAERRELLLTIEALDPAYRKQVEAAADQGGVAMDALYGIVRSLGAEGPIDPAQLATVLDAQVKALQDDLKDATDWTAKDEEIARLLALADKAEAEGALKSARHFADLALDRDRAHRAKREDEREAMKALDLDSARVAGAAGEKDYRDGAYMAAAGKYAEAFGLAEPWDKAVAADMKAWEAFSLAEHGDKKGDNQALEASIVSWELVIRLTDKEKEPGLWAARQLTYGNALFNLGANRTGTELLEKSIAAYLLAIEVLTRERVPLDWAMAQNNLGAALWELGSREAGTDRLEEAAVAFRLSLEERTRDRAPLFWAETQNNLGNVLAEFGRRNGSTELLEQAVLAYNLALAEWTRDLVPSRWAIAQSNLGVALMELGVKEQGTTSLEGSVKAYRLSLEETPRSQLPLRWATTQNNLGNVLIELGRREEGTARLEEAVVVLRLALEERTRVRVPLEWAQTQSNLGVALRALGRREIGTARFEEAETAYRLSLEVRSRDESPLEWAATQNNLGNVLWEIALREVGTENLKEALVAFKLALEERTRSQVPFDWADSQRNLGNVFYELGRRETFEVWAEEAVTAYRNALQIFSRDQTPKDWATAQFSLGDALALLGERQDLPLRLASWKGSVAAWREVQLVYTLDTSPAIWAQMQNSIGYRLTLIAEATNDEAGFIEAVGVLREAVVVQAEHAPDALPYAQDSLCRALMNLGRLRADRGILGEARGLCEAALAGALAQGADWSADETRANLAAIDAAVAALP